MCFVARDANNENHQCVSKQRRVAQKKNKRKNKKIFFYEYTQNKKIFYTPVLRVVHYERNGWMKDALRCKGHQQ